MKQSNLVDILSDYDFHYHGNGVIDRHIYTSYQLLLKNDKCWMEIIILVFDDNLKSPVWSFSKNYGMLWERQIGFCSYEAIQGFLPEALQEELIYALHEL